MAKVTPLFNNVVIRRDDAVNKSDGGILIPDSAKGKSSRGTVVSVGTGRWMDGKFVETTLKEGDSVLFGSYAGTEVQVGKDTLLVMQETEVLAKV